MKRFAIIIAFILSTCFECEPDPTLGHEIECLGYVTVVNDLNIPICLFGHSSYGKTIDVTDSFLDGAAPWYPDAKWYDDSITLFDRIVKGFDEWDSKPSNPRYPSLIIKDEHGIVLGEWSYSDESDNSFYCEDNWSLACIIHNYQMFSAG